MPLIKKNNATKKSEHSAGDDTLVMGKVTHRYHEDKYFALIILFFVLFFLTLVTFFWAFYERSLRMPTEYFPTTLDGKLVETIPLDKPNLSGAALLQWTVEAMTSAYTFNFVDYRKALQTARSYFTQTGYMQYLNELRNFNTIGLVAEKKYVLSVAPTSAPILLKEKVIDGLYTWYVQLPIVITYTSSREETKEYFSITMLVIRVPTTDSPKGVAVAGIIVKETRRA